MSERFFGWVPPDQRTPEQAKSHEAAVLSMPEFRIVGTRSDTNKAYLWDFTKAANGGEHFRTFYQQTGSCVGNGLGQAVWFLSAMEVVRLGDREQVLLPFWLLPYGKSRQYAGMRGRGEGSFGSTAAKAIQQDGILPAKTEGLPQPSDKGGLTWGADVEYDWSDGAAIPRKWLDLSRKHLVKTVAQAKSADDVSAGLRNGYPWTIASDWGGAMRPSVQGDRLLNSHQDTWQHQMCVVGWEDHLQLGEIFYILNSWGVGVHGTCPSGAQPGGFWVRKKEMEYIVRQGETFGLSQFDGFPAQELEKELFRIIGA